LTYRVWLTISYIFLPKIFQEKINKNWVKANREGKFKEVGKQQRPLTEIEMELARVKRELAEVGMERGILKKAAAYFAKESLPGTRS